MKAVQERAKGILVDLDPFHSAYFLMKVNLIKTTGIADPRNVCNVPEWENMKENMKAVENK